MFRATSGLCFQRSSCRALGTLSTLRVAITVSQYKPVLR